MRALTPDCRSSHIRKSSVHPRGRAEAHDPDRAVTFAMVEAYWNIGCLIDEEEQQEKQQVEYGTYLLWELSVRLTQKFGKGWFFPVLRR